MLKYKTYTYYLYLILIILIITLILIRLIFNNNKTDNFYSDNKINISLGILSYNAPNTLNHTLQTYKDSGLFDISNDIFAILQKSDKQDEEANICEKYQIRFIKMPDNGKMSSGFKAIYENAKNEIIIFLENDFVNYCSKQESIDFFNNSIHFIKDKNIDLVRARNRKNAGEPNIAIGMFKHLTVEEFKNNIYLSECIYWIDDPEIIYPENIQRIIPLIANDKWYISSSKYCCWTNNAFITSKQFFKEAILPNLFSSENIEDTFTNIWAQQNYKCVYGPGLFTHERLDGH